MDKMKIRGVQFSSGRICHYFKVSNDELLITIDCDLGSLIVTEKELLSYLKSRNSLKDNIESPNSADVKPEVGAQPPKQEYNTAKNKICTDIISNCICDYCVHKPGMASDYCGDCSGGSEFVGRKLRPC